MATIVLQGQEPKAGGDARRLQAPYSTTATVSASPGRIHQATINGRRRDFERVGVDSSGNEVYRDQSRRPVR